MIVFINKKLIIKIIPQWKQNPAPPLTLSLSPMRKRERVWSGGLHPTECVFKRKNDNKKKEDWRVGREEGEKKNFMRVWNDLNLNFFLKKYPSPVSEITPAFFPPLSRREREIKTEKIKN
jgi:hypothetical protein